MSSIIRWRSGVVLSSFTGTSCLTIEKIPIVRPEDPVSEKWCSDQRADPATGALAARAA
jgi:hypothetical protein